MPDLALRGLSPELHRALKRAARKNHRSLNGEVLARLEASLAPPTVDIDSLLARIAERRARTPVPDLDPAELKRLRESGRP